MFNLSSRLQKDLWWLIISVDYHYNRIAIADHELTGGHLTLWLEDKQDYKNALEECLILHIPLRIFSKVIQAEGLHTYEALQPSKRHLYKATVEINKPLLWYQQDATPVEQRWAREAVVKSLLTELVENTRHYDYNYAI